MRKAFAALIAALALIAAFGASAETQNLILNPDFEAVGSTNLPDGWYRDLWDVTEGVSNLTVSQDGYTGACVAVENVTENDARFAQDVTVEPDTLYEISCMVRAEGISAEGIGANLSVKDTFSYSGSVFDTAGQWQKLTLYGRTGEDQTTLTVLARVGGYGSVKAGTAYFDSFTMTEIGALPAGATESDFEGISSSASVEADDNAMPERNTQAWLLASFAIALVAAALLRKPNRAPLAEPSRYLLQFGLLLVVALAVRVYIAVAVRGYDTDIDCFTAWSEHIYRSGYANFYATVSFCDYPPLYMALLWFVAALRDILGIAYNSAAHILLIKLMPIFCDALIAYLAYSFASRRLNARAAMLIGAVCALNPAAIVDSAAWGQIDSVFTLFIVLGAVYLSEERYLPALPMFAVAMLMKPQALLFAPLGLVALVANLVRRWDAKKALRALVGLVISLALILIAVLVFHKRSENPFQWFTGLYFGTMNSYDKLTVNALNLYELLGLNWADTSAYPWLTRFAWGLFVLSYVYSAVLYVRAKKPGAIFLSGAVLIMLICAFGPMIHERYVYPAVALLLFAYAQERDRRILYSLAVLTITLFLNQILVLQGGMTEANYGHLQSSENWLNAPLSLIVMANAAYAGYVGFSLYFRAKRLPIDPPAATEPPRPETTLFGGRDYKLALKRFDYLFMAGVTLAYAVLAFTNLGTTKAPQTSWTASQDGEAVVFDLGEIRTFRMEYYGGICDTTFTVEQSNDGAVWTEPFTAVYEDGQIFRWIFYAPSDDALKSVYGETVPTTDGSAYVTFASGSDKYPFQTARYVRITAKSEGLVLSEVGFLGADGAPYPVSILSQTGYLGETKVDAAALIDEQDAVPEKPSYLNSTYFDEIYHARTAYEHLNNIHTYEWTHPPLGKVLMMIGIELFGMCPFGWRFMGTLMGVFMLPVLYLMVKQLGGSRKLAALAMLLMALDSMHFTQTRIATIDSYAVFFIMLMYLFMFRYLRMSFHRQPLLKTLIPLALCGITMGLAWATKWIGLYASAGLAILFFWSLISRCREHRYALTRADDEFQSDEEKRALASARRDFWKNTIATLLVCVVFFLAVPALIYYLSYYWQMRPDGGLTIQRVLDMQKTMYGYHSGLTNDDHYFRSPWYQWPVIGKPMWYYDGKSFLPSGMVSSISCMGNPAVWWTGLAAILTTIFSCAWKRRAHARDCVLAVSFLSQYLPWVLVPRSTFIYHYFASVPFIIIATAFLLGKLERKHKNAFLYAAMGLVALALILFVAFYPLESGTPVALAYAKYLRWFDWYNY